jgi:Kdo2-lipid IVA lauroyltransferase/acyltransferase
MTDKLTFYLFRAFTALFSIIPFRILYIISDGLFFLIYHVVSYRKKVVFENLRNSFPEKTDQEINEIAVKFYHHLVDVLVEGMKSFSMSEDEVIVRFRYLNPEVVDDLYKKGKQIIVVAGHYNNWEWAGIASGKQMLHRPVGFYKPMTNKYVDAFVQTTRVQGRSVLASIEHTVATFKTDWGEPAAFYMISDQSPSSPRLAYWVRFMNQDTATLHGPEKYARIHDLPVVFVHVRKIKRGFYEVEFSLLEENPASTRTGEITTRFMQKLEEVIRENPQYYLWSHRRWKYKKAVNQNILSNQ